MTLMNSGQMSYPYDQSQPQQNASPNRQPPHDAPHYHPTLPHPHLSQPGSRQGVTPLYSPTHAIYTNAPPQFFAPPSENNPITGRSQPSLSLSLPPGPCAFPDPDTMSHSLSYQQQLLISPYTTPALQSLGSASVDSGSGLMSDYFPPFASFAISAGGSSHQAPLPSPSWVSAGSSLPNPSSRPRTVTSPSGSSHSMAKTSRQQFTACGACRHRRVKCDLKDRQDQAERAGEDERGVGPHRGQSSKKKVFCTNCVERGTNCVDEYAPLKAAKQLRRGKRISEIEMLYGRSLAKSTVPLPSSLSDSSPSPIKGKEVQAIPDLTQTFFQSPFFRRWQVQRPLLDPVRFVNRYFSAREPCAASMGPAGAILCHILYAWAVSYGVDEHGELDVAEGGEVPDGPVNLASSGPGEMKREADRQTRREKLKGVLEVILKEIDDCGLLRKPTWDGVRSLLLILPLTEGMSSPVERLQMYECAINQVYLLCSFDAMGYDGQPSATSGVNGGSDYDGTQSFHHIRIRIYWYAFVHEGITTGLKGGRLHLDDEDIETMQESINSRALVLDPAFHAAVRFATAPINLALACRLINKALTGPSARRRTILHPDLLAGAWEALEQCWEEFEQVKYTSSVVAYGSPDEIIRFADGWKIFLFEAQNVIRTTLEERLAKITASQSTAYIGDQTFQPDAMLAEVVNLQHLLDIAKGKCEAQTRHIINMVKHHVGTRFFEWDASLVRDGTYYTAMLLAKAGGSDEDVAVCLQALNELRWAHAKAWERSAALRQEWANHRPPIISKPTIHGWDPSFSHVYPRNIPLSGFPDDEDESSPESSEQISPVYYPSGGPPGHPNTTLHESHNWSGPVPGSLDEMTHQTFSSHPEGQAELVHTMSGGAVPRGRYVYLADGR